jgi:hypothetical protein
MLRTNVTLEVFDYIYLADPRHLDMLLELLRTSNFMLRQIALWAVRGPPFYEHECQARIKRVLSRNERLMKAYDRLCLQVPRVRKSLASRGPEAIARISAFPNPRVLLRQRGH